MREKKGIIAADQQIKACNLTESLGGRTRGKMKRIWLGGLCLGFSVALSACGTGGRSFEEQSVTVIQGAQNQQSAGNAQGEQSAGSAQNQQEAAGTQAYEALRAQVLSEITDEEKNWMGGLSSKQRLADFESLCEGLRENYPYVKLAKRQAGADLDALETEYRAKVEQCENDDAFYYVLKDFIGEFSGMGHLDLWGRRYESELASIQKAIKEPQNREKPEPYVDALDNPVSHRTYASMTKYYQDVE